MNYVVGDRVRICGVWYPEAIPMVNEEGLMDHWQDQTMTIRAIDVSYGGPWYRMVEDGEENGGEGWYWKDSMIDCLEEQESDFDGDEFESAIL